LPKSPDSTIGAAFAAPTVTSVKALVPRRNSLNLLIFTLRAGRTRSYPSTPCSGTITPDIR